VEKWLDVVEVVVMVELPPSEGMIPQVVGVSLVSVSLN
jgi:hypothetical protein